MWDPVRKSSPESQKEPDCDRPHISGKGIWDLASRQQAAKTVGNFVFLVKNTFSDNKSNSICGNFGNYTQEHQKNL